MANLSKYGGWALVAGAAEGIGKAFCEYLAAEKVNIILLDTNTDVNKTLADTLHKKYDIRTEHHSFDLADRDAPNQIVFILKKKECRLIVYNAAYGPVKRFSENSPEELDRYLDVNCRTPLHLVHRIAPHWNLKPGAIVLMSSLAGLYGTQLVSPYSATKAFDINLGEALYHELKSNHIDILVCCAGATDTPNFRNTQPDLTIFPRPHISQPKYIPIEAFKHLGKKPIHIVGHVNRLNYFILSRILTRNRASKIFNQTMAKIYKTKNEN